MQRSTTTDAATPVTGVGVGGLTVTSPSLQPDRERAIRTTAAARTDARTTH
ncbi:MAG: hypothetical protein ACTHMZ_14820 [Actinomycetes bacterium]